MGFCTFISYVFQTHVVGGIVVTDYVGAAVEGIGDVGRGVDDLVASP